MVFHAAAASSIGADPGPEYIRAELISGGNAAKSSMVSPGAQRVAAALAASVAAYDPALLCKVATNFSCIAAA